MKLLVISESPLTRIGDDYYAFDPWIRIPCFISDQFDTVTLLVPVAQKPSGEVPPKGSWKVEIAKLKMAHLDNYCSYIQYYKLFPFRFLAWQKMLRVLMREHDAIIMRGPSPITPLVMSCARKENKPVVLMLLLDIVTQSDRLIASRGLARLFYSFVTNILVLLEKRAAAQAVLTYVYNKEMYERHKKYSGKMILTQDPHIKMADIVLRQDTCQDPVIKLLRICWLIPSKGVESLLQAIAILRNKNVPVHLDIVGQERTKGYQSQLESMVRDLGIVEHVTFSGWVPYDQVKGVYFNHDIQVISSLAEGTPRCIVEGFARGLPLVCTAVGGCKDTLIHEKDALLVAANDAQDMADAIQRLIGEKALRQAMIKNGYEAVKAVTFENLGLQMIAQIKQVLGRERE